MNTVNIKPYVPLENKTFRSKVVIKINNSDFIGIPYQTGTPVISFVGCVFQDLVIENDENINFDEVFISFMGCIVERLEINNIKSENISVSAIFSIISGLIDTNKLQSVNFNNVVAKGIFLKNQNSVDISYTEENIFTNIWDEVLRKCRMTCLELLSVKQSYYVDDSKKVFFRINEAKDGRVGLIHDSFRGGTQYETRYQLTKEQKSYLNLNISLDYQKKTEQSEIKIIDSFLNSLTIRGRFDGKLSVENCKVKNWYIHEFSIKGEATFYDIKPLKSVEDSSVIEIRQCNLDNVWFDNFRFSDYGIVSFYRTRLGKAVFSSCSFPSNYTTFEKFNSLPNVHYPANKSDNYYKDQYEIFLQLRAALDSNGNFYEAQKLQAISNDALKQISDVSKWDKAILLINSKSNNHGISIKLPLIYFFIITIIFYLLYLGSLGRVFNANGFDSSLIGYYFSFIDPTHRAEFLVDKKEFNAFSLGIDFLNKLASAFLIFQFIAAFRKYGKSKG